MTSFEEDVSDTSNTRLLVHDQSDKEPFIEEGSRSLDTTAIDIVKGRTTGTVLLATVIALLLGTNILTYWVTASSVSKKSACRSVAEPPKVAPMLRDLELDSFHYRFESTFFDQNNPFRRPPSPATDKFWEDAGANFGFLLIPDEDMEASDLSPEHIHLRGGADQANLSGIPVNVEVFHQLHCLNMMRKTTWYNYDYYRKLGEGPFRHPDRDLAIHVDHCIDNLRQRIMCTADVGLVPFYWVGEDEGTDPEFSRVHTCRDYESLRDWMFENMHRLGNDTIHPKPEDFRVDGFH